MSAADDIRFVRVDGPPITLREARENWLHGDPDKLRPPTLVLLDTLNGAIDQTAGSMLVDMLTAYPAYEPALTTEMRHELLIRALGKSDGQGLPFELALHLAIAGRPAIASLFAHVAQRAIADDELHPLQLLLEYVLPDEDAWGHVIEAVRAWPDTPALRAIRSWVGPRDGD